MILPILAYGHPTLKKVAKDIDKDYPDLHKLIADMWETMYFSHGVGLAAPQVNKSIRLQVIDATPFAEEDERARNFKKVMINAQIIHEEGEEWPFNEGCLSIPEIREDVYRKPKIKIQYYDENWNYFEETFDSVMARIIQHEYDHLEGKLFVDRLSSIRRMLLKRRLNDIATGKVQTDYRMIFASNKR
ncbi:MAG: peptide deformylase [Bacteroidota bacterium]